MRRRTKLIIGGLTAALALAATLSNADARRFEFGTRTWAVPLKNFTFQNANIRIVCDITVEGSFHSRTISKVSGQLIGYVTRVVFHHPCIENEAEALAGTLPWHILYLRFIGALPNITGIEIQLNNGGVLGEVGISCLYEATAGAGWRFILDLAREPGGRIQWIRVRSAGGTVNKRSGGILCPGSIESSGEGTAETEEEGLRRLIFVRLVA